MTAAASENACPSPGPSAGTVALRGRLECLLGPLAAFELNGKLPCFRLPAAELPVACRKLRDAGFDYLVLVTAVDYPVEKRFVLDYVISNYAEAPDCAQGTDVDREDPHVESVAGSWEAADWHEREVYDLFGIRFDHHPDLRRILLDNTWEGYPLRKDYVDKVHDVIKRPY